MIIEFWVFSDISFQNQESITSEYWWISDNLLWFSYMFILCMFFILVTSFWLNAIWKRIWLAFHLKVLNNCFSLDGKLLSSKLKRCKTLCFHLHWKKHVLEGLILGKTWSDPFVGHVHYVDGFGEAPSSLSNRVSWQDNLWLSVALSLSLS